MSREAVLAILQRTATDLDFRQRYEQNPAQALAEYGPELTNNEWQLLIRYPSLWLDKSAVATCPQCGALAVIAETGEVAFCPACQAQQKRSGCC